MIKNAIWLFFITFTALIVFLPSYTRMQDLRQKNEEYVRQIRVLEAKNAQMKREKLLLERDPVYLEKVAREKMGLIREGEVIYKITPNEQKAPVRKGSR